MKNEVFKKEFLVISALLSIIAIFFILHVVSERNRRRVPEDVRDWLRYSPKGLTMFTSPNDVIEHWVVSEAKLADAFKMLESRNFVLLSKAEAEQITKKTLAHSAGYYYLGRGVGYGSKTKIVGRLPNIGTAIVAGNDFRQLRRLPVVFHIDTTEFEYYVEFSSSGWNVKSGAWDLWGLLKSP